MAPLKTVVIRMAPSKKGTCTPFYQKIAGLSIFKRLVLSLQRAGMENFIILAQDISSTDKNWVVSDLKNDFRFKSNLQWNDLSKDTFENKLNSIGLPLGQKNILFAEGDIVTTAGLIKDFVTRAIGFKVTETAGLIPGPGPSDGMYILPFSNINHYLNFGAFEKPLALSALSGPWSYCQRTKDPQSVQFAEKKLLNEHKFHYKQAMDIWFNSLFSIKISSLLVKTPLTPNQITLFGLIIGMAAGILFAQGNYWSSLMGGLLAIGTAIWDCCDGDVARLKFMESDFGEKLDTTCDNIINIFIFTGIMLGITNSKGLTQAMIPFFLLTLGGCLIFYLIYFPKGGKGSFFINTPIHSVIQTLASRNFIHIIFFFSIIGSLDWFLWLAGIGSNIFAISIFIAKKKILDSKIKHG